MERTAKVDFATIQGGLFSPSGADRANQMRSAMEGLGLSMKKMNADERAFMQERGKSILPYNRDDPIAPIVQRTRKELREMGKDTGVVETKFARVVRGVALTGLGIEAASIATKAWRRDWEGIGEQINTLPFGIGHVARQLSDMIDLGIGLGFKDQTDRNNNYASAMGTLLPLQRGEQSSLMAMRRQTMFGENSLNRELGMLGLRGSAKDSAEIKAESQAKIDAIKEERRQIEEAHKEERSRARDALNSVPQMITAKGDSSNVRGIPFSGAPMYSPTISVANPQRAAAEIAYNAILKTQTESLKEFGKRELAEQKAQAARLAQAEKDDAEVRSEAIVSIHTEIGAMRLQMIDKNTDAEVLRIRDGAKQRANAEREIGHGDVADKILEQSELQVAQIKQQRERQTADAILGIRAETSSMMLSMQRKDLEAQKVQVAESYRERIEQAKRAGQEEVAARLGVQQVLAEANATYQYNQGIVSGQSLPMLSAFANPTVAVSGKQQREDALGQSQLKTLEKVKELLDKIEQNTKDQGVRVGNN